MSGTAAFSHPDGRMSLINGHVLDALRSLPAGSVHCCVSSPPYFRLRDYGTPPQVWGGDPVCRHDWREVFSYRNSPTRASSAQVFGTDAATSRRQRWSLSASCLRCGAWRGSLGMEEEADCVAWARGEPPCPACYVCHIRTVFLELRRVLRPDGTVWWNVGDCYNNSGGAGGDYRSGGLREGQPGFPGRYLKRLPAKSLVGIPWRTALALQADGWTIRSDIIWNKTNVIPQSVRDRPTSAHEHVFLLSRSPRYYYDLEAIREPLLRPEAPAALNPILFGGRNKHGGYGTRTASGHPYESAPRGHNRRDVWRLPTSGFRGARLLADFTDGDGTPYRASARCAQHSHLVGTAARSGAAPSEDRDAGCPCEPVTVDHFATFPAALVEPCILAGTSERGACPSCGAPWKRVLEAERVVSGPQPGFPGHGYGGRPRKDYASAGAQDPAATKRRILAGMARRLSTRWVPGCPCGMGTTVPCTVLDPFAGSGTAGEVALSLGRRFVGIDLNPGYCELAAARLRRHAPAKDDRGTRQLPEAGAAHKTHTGQVNPSVGTRHWRLARDGDPDGLRLYLRHYSARRYRDGRPRRLFVGPGERMVLLSPRRDALFVWRKFRDRSGQEGVNAAVFRNEGSYLSSLLIQEAMRLAWRRWPGVRLYTYVNPARVRSTNPGCCFKAAGWKPCGRTKGGLVVLEARP